MDAARRERRAHGTQGFPFQIYSAPQAQDSDLVPYHWHPETEIIIVLHGTVGVTIADRQYAGQEGDVFFASSGQLHEIRGGVNNRFRAFVFPMDFLQFRRADLAQSELLAPLEEGTLRLPAYVPHGTPVGRELFRELKKMIRICADQPLGYQLLVKSSLLYLIGQLAGAGLLETRPQRTGEEYKVQLLRRIVEYLGEHCTERLRLADVAAQFGLSPQYFCSFFKENLGRTLVQHINFLRIERASRLLRETDLTILEISLSVGFDNVSYFIKRFRAVYGCTPTDYRRSVGSRR